MIFFSPSKISGTGFRVVNIDRIFDMFFTTKLHKMGMGLAICRSIVEFPGWASNIGGARSPVWSNLKKNCPQT